MGFNKSQLMDEKEKRSSSFRTVRTRRRDPETGISFVSVLRFTGAFLKQFFFPDKRMDAVNDSGDPLVLGDPNRGYTIRHTTPEGNVYTYKGDGWYNSETGKTYDDEQTEV